MACDYRIMVRHPKFQIGLNQVDRIGMSPQKWFFRHYSDLIGRDLAEHGLQLGLLFYAENAIEIGLVNEICSIQELDEVALDICKEYLDRPDHVRISTKLEICRKDRIQKFNEEIELDLNDYLRNVTNEDVQKNIEKYIAALRARKIKKNRPFTNENLV